MTVRRWAAQRADSAKPPFGSEKLVTRADAGQAALISTGTPAGVGSSTGTFLKPGDIVRATIAPIGMLENPVEGER